MKMKMRRSNSVSSLARVICREHMLNGGIHWKEAMGDIPWGELGLDGLCYADRAVLLRVSWGLAKHEIRKVKKLQAMPLVGENAVIDSAIRVRARLFRAAGGIGEVRRAVSAIDTRIAHESRVKNLDLRDIAALKGTSSR